MGEIGHVLTDRQFMESLPLPSAPTKIYAGIAGPRGRYSPFGEELNDGLLTVKETLLPSVPVQTVPALHTFIMNSKVVTQDIVRIARQVLKHNAKWFCRINETVVNLISVRDGSRASRASR
jgi:hypothetical protein